MLLLPPPHPSRPGGPRRRRRRHWLVAAAFLASGSLLAAQNRPPTGALTAATQRPVPGGRFEQLLVAGQVHLLAGTGANVVVQAGEEGAVFVDTSVEGASRDLLAAVARLTTRPIRYVINTSADADHVGGNETISNAGRNFATPAPNTAGIGAPAAGAGGGAGGNQQRTTGAQVYAHEAVLNRMSGAFSGGRGAVPFALWPSDTFFTSKKTLYFNGEPIELLHQPAAHTDGDVMVWFRKSDVVAAGDVYTPDRFPMIDVDRGGTVRGLLDALNRIIDITVPRFNQQGGTLVVGGHGRIANESDVVEYRDMATIVRDRIQLMLSKNMTLEQVRAANPVLDYDGIYGTSSGAWTTDMFVAAVYRDLSKTSAPSRRGQ
jgi:glyoxylase-like metal-dependent hydrolase (beta-lactamase superfamily II)